MTTMSKNLIAPNTIKGDLPAVLVLKRKSIRLFPQGQKVAMYHIKELNTDISIPYSTMNENVIEFDDGNSLLISEGQLNKINSLYSKLNEENKNELIEIMHENLESFNSVLDFIEKLE